MTQALKRGGGGGIGGIGPAILPLEVALPIGQGSYTTGMGKGLSEPCSPYREAYFFGAPLNIPNADNWNCVPQIIEPTTSFDLSLITPYHEVVVAILTAYNLPAGSSYWVHQKWYRDRDGQLLFDFAYTIPDPASWGYDYWPWYYVYSYIGYVPWEIWENGGYHVVLTLSGGAQSFSQTLNFTVTGIPVEPVELAGEIFETYIWWEGPVWINLVSGMEVPLGVEIYILPYWRSDVTITGHMDLEVTYPDGTKLSLAATGDQDWEGQGHGVTFEPFVSSQGGTYTIVITLSHEGQVLDSVTLELQTTAVVPEYKGTLTRMELEYDETWGAIPVSNIPQGQRGIVHIWGRNDTPVAQRMGIYWFVADPDGYVVQEYSTWEAWPYTGAGKEHGFYSGRFNLDKVGKYTIWVELLMNRDDPQVVDQYIGALCIVAAVVPEPEFALFGITEYTK